jgi:hypothetical protein
MKKQITYLDSSQKNTLFQKKNLKWISGSEDVIDLKINSFRVFSGDE